uniref:Putative immunosuppressant protein p36 n=1 Tax=Rhipicephalus microplus TaxID=6941 RepID=A0A6G5AEJ2_RHIMP
MTDKYDYWTQTKQLIRGHPIKLNVSALSCVAENNDDGVQRMDFRYDCETEFSLYIEKGLQSVFNINTTVSFPLIKNSYKERNVVMVNLNNEEEVHKTIQQKSGWSEIRGCDFVVTVTMDGSFAYHSRRRRGNYYNVSVKHLRDYKVKLLKRGKKLQYNITGSYVEKICL